MLQVLLLWPTFFLLDCIDSLAGVVPSARKHAGRRETIRDQRMSATVFDFRPRLARVRAPAPRRGKCWRATDRPSATLAAEHTMPPEQPQIARLRHRMLGHRRRVVGVRQPCGPVGHDVFEFAEPGKR